MAMDSDKLLNAAVKGDVEAFETLTGKYVKPVYRAMLAVCSNRGDAAEIAQEVFVRVFKNISSIHSVPHLSSEVYRTVRDVCKENPGCARKIS